MVIPVVDVSHHQGAINFPHMRAVGIRGVILRVGDEQAGSQPSDRRFAQYLGQALGAGLALGSYIFCRPTSGSAAAFGRRYAAVIRTYAPGVRFDLGHYPDHETFWAGGACPISPAAYDAWVWDHSRALDDGTQQESGIYTGTYHWNTWVRSSRHGFRRLWLARYPYGRVPAPTNPTPDLDSIPDDWEDWAMRKSPPSPPAGWKTWDAWQFSSAGPGSYYGVSSAGLDLCLWKSELSPPPPAPIPSPPSQEADVRLIVIVPGSHPDPQLGNRWPHWRLTGEHIISANGAPPLEGSKPILGIPTVELPKGHRPILGLEPAADGNGVVAIADDQGTFTFRRA